MHQARLTIAAVAIASLLTAPLASSRAAVVKPVSFAILEDYDKGDDLKDIARDFALFRELEITTWRGSFGWDDYEPERGRYDLDWLEQFVQLAYAYGITLRPYLGYTPEWAAREGGQDEDVWNNPPKDLDRFTRFAEAVASRFRNYRNLPSYEIYNEENVPMWWDGDARTYAQLLARGARSIRRADSDARILFGGLVFPDVKWIETVCSERGIRDAFDVLPFHAYPETWTPPDVTVENYLSGVDDFARSADDSCGPKAIWINETGFATVPGKSEREQAAWWVRAIATFLAHPRIEHIGIYEIKDLPTDKPVIGDAPNYHLGLTRSDRSKKLAFHTVDMLTDLLDTGTLQVIDEAIRVSGGTNVFHHAFERPDGDRVLIIWTRNAAEHVEITTDTSYRSVVELALDGSSSNRPPIDAHVAQSVDLEQGSPRVFRLQR